MDSRIYILTHKRLTGQLSALENEELQQLNLIAENRALSEEISYLWNVSKNYFPKRDWQKEAAKEAFYQRIRSSEVSASTSQSALLQVDWIKVGAVAIIALLSYFALNWFFQKPAEVIQASQPIEYAEIMDDTKVWLMDGAVVTILEESSSSRKIALNGEAIFDVNHNPLSPFTIDLGENITIEVLGTSFKAISTHDNDGGVVSVRDGTVKLYDHTDPDAALFLNAGEMGVLKPGGRPLKTENEGKYSFYSAQDAEPLKFKNTSLSNVFDELGMFYGVSFSLEDADLNACLFSGIVHKDISIEETISSITEVHPNVSIVAQQRSTYKVSGYCD